MRKLQMTCWLIASLVPTFASAQSYEKALMYYDNGLLEMAQKELIDVAFDGKSGEKPKALESLASIAIEKNNVKAAVSAIERLIKEHPKSAEAENAKKRLPELSSSLQSAIGGMVQDATSRVYLKNANFWSKGKSSIFTIDSSWIANVEAAIYWYDKTINEFSDTPAARMAFEEKMMTLLGWKDSGKYGESHGVEGQPNKYIPMLVSTFREYEKNFPDAGSLQAFRYQIAQAHWANKKWPETKAWLKEIIEKDGGRQSFYKDLAERRMRKVEY